jgi:hypothetical protein
MREVKVWYNKGVAMGTIQHTALIVTGDKDVLEKAHKKARKFMSKKSVTAIVGQGMNGYYSFMIAPCGSKLGWEVSNDYLEGIEKMIDYLGELDSEEFVEWVTVEYGECGKSIK